MVATPQPNPRRRPMTVPTPPPVGRGAGIMALPMRRPTAVERKRGRRFQYPGDPRVADPRSFSERMAEGADVLEGIGAGAVAGVGGLIPDILALVGRDAPMLFSKYVMGKPLSEDENAVFRALTKVQDVAGAEAILRGMGYGEKMDAPSDSPDALSQMGVNPFRQGAFFGEFVADPFAAFKGIKALKALGPSDEAVAAYDRQLAGAQADAQQRMGTDEEVLEFFDELAGNTPEVSAREQRFNELREQAPITRGIVDEGLDGEGGEYFIVRMPDGTEVEGATEDELRNLYAVQAQVNEDGVPDDVIEMIDNMLNADELENVPFESIRFQTQVPRAENAGGTILNYTGLEEPQLRDLSLNEALFSSIDARRFNFGPDGVTPVREADNQIQNFQFIEFAEDRIEPRTGDTIPAGTTIAFPDEAVTGINPDSFFRRATDMEQLTPPSATPAANADGAIARDRGFLPLPQDVQVLGGESLLDVSAVMPMNASTSQLVPQQVPFTNLPRQGDVVDYSPMHQLVSSLPDGTGGFMAKGDILDILRSGSGESLNRDRDSSGFIQFLEKFGADQMSSAEVRQLYRDHTPQLRVKTIRNSHLDYDRKQGGPVDFLRDYAQVTVPDEYLAPVRKLDQNTGEVTDRTVGEKIHIYLGNPNSVLPLTGDDYVQLRGGLGVSDHSLGASGGFGESGRGGPPRGGVPGYFGHIRMHVIEDDQGRRMGVIQEIQSNAATEERRTARGDTSKKFFSPEASYTLDLLRESEEGRRVFEAAARSSKPRDTALEDAVGELGQMADDAYNEMGNDLPIIGGVNVSRADARDTIDTINATVPPGVTSISGGFSEMTDLVLDVAPRYLAARGEQNPSDLSYMFDIGGYDTSREIFPTSFDLSRAEGTTTAVSLERMFLADGVLTPEEINKFNSGFMARLEDIDAIDQLNAGAPNQRALLEEYLARGGAQQYAAMYYDKLRDATRGLDEGDPNAVTPYDYFKQQFEQPGTGISDLRMIIMNDPALFGFVGADITEPLNATHQSRAAMMARTMMNRINTEIRETLDDSVRLRGQLVPDDVPRGDSIAAMNQVIDNEFSSLPPEVVEEMKQHFETYVNTINDVTSFDAFKVNTPFSGRSSDAYFTQFSTRLALQEAEKAGLDGVIFPNWMDMRDAPTRDGIPAQEIYGNNIDKGLKQAGLKMTDDNRGPADVKVLPTILAKNQNTGMVEPLPHMDGPARSVRGRAEDTHREARAVYFGQDRTRIKRYRPEERPATGEQTYTESIGTIGSIYDDKLIRRAKGGPVDLRPKKLVHSGIGAMARQVM